MESVTWVCEDALDNHAWVLELAIFMQKHEVLMALNHEIDVPGLDQRFVDSLHQKSPKSRNTTKSSTWQLKLRLFAL